MSELIPSDLKTKHPKELVYRDIGVYRLQHKKAAPIPKIRARFLIRIFIKGDPIQ